MKNNSDIRTMLKEAGILFGITLIAGLMLGFVYELTKEPIRIQQEKAVQEACMAVFSGQSGLQFEEFPYEEDVFLTGELAEEGVQIGTVYKAISAEGAFQGFVIESKTSKGYGGNIVLYVGVTGDGAVSGVSILEISETPGLGMEAPNVLAPQFAGKQVDAFSYTKNGSMSEEEVDAISGATITTRAVVSAVNGALKMSQDLLMGGVVNE